MNGTASHPKMTNTGSLMLRIVASVCTGKKRKASFDTHPTVFPSKMEAAETRNLTSSSTALNIPSKSSIRNPMSLISSKKCSTPLREARRILSFSTLFWSKMCLCRFRNAFRAKEMSSGNSSSQWPMLIRLMTYCACVRNIATNP